MNDDELHTPAPHLTEMDLQQVYHAVKDLLSTLEDRIVRSSQPRTYREKLVIRDGLRSLSLIDIAFSNEDELL